MQERTPQPDGEVIVHIGPCKRPQKPEKNGKDKIKPRNPGSQCSAVSQKPGGNHHNLAGKRDERTFNRHKNKYDDESPNNRVRCGKLNVTGNDICHLVPFFNCFLIIFRYENFKVVLHYL